jgi:hypothetical protein
MRALPVVTLAPLAPAWQSGFETTQSFPSTRALSLSAAEQQCHNGSSLARNFTRKPAWGMLTIW